MPSPDQIKERPEEQPDHVDEVPVETAELERDVAVLVGAKALRAAGEPGEHRDADEDVERVEPGHEVVEVEEHLLAARSRSAPGEQTLADVVRPLDALQDEERRAERASTSQQEARERGTSAADCVDGEDDEEAAREEDHRVRRAEREERRARAVAEAVRVSGAERAVETEERRE